MNISPVLLFVIGSVFGLAYASCITIGWGITRKNRRLLQENSAVSYLPIFNIEKNRVEDISKKIKTVSIYNNKFVTSEGTQILTADYRVYIVAGKSERYPTIKSGDMIFIDKDGFIKYAFEVPDLKNYR